MVDEEENCTEGPGAQNLLCIARRIPFNEKHLSPPLEQFTIKLDQNGKILALDTKDVSDMYARHINNVRLKSIVYTLCYLYFICLIISFVRGF